MSQDSVVTIQNVHMTVEEHISKHVQALLVLHVSSAEWSQHFKFNIYALPLIELKFMKQNNLQTTQRSI
jgi:hypothetical protein